MIMHTIHRLQRRRFWMLMAFVLLFSTTNVLADDDWKLKKDKDDIQIFVRKVPGSKFREFKATTILQAGMISVLSLMEDLDSYKQLFPALLEVKLLKQISSSEFIMYQLIKVPFPAENRDSVIRVKAVRTPLTRGVTFQLTSMWNYLPERKDAIRVKNLCGSWTFTPNPDGSTVTVVYQLYSEPGGQLPPWIANIAIVKRPFTALSNMKKVVMLSKYRNAKAWELHLFR